jgi:hypothetical protein
MSSPLLIFGPIPAYQNVPINPQWYLPSQFFISGVSLGPTTIVTTTADVNYVIGNLCRLIIPQSFGCRELNEIIGLVLSLPAPNQVELAIDSSQNVSAFIASSAKTQPQILAIGDLNSGAINTTGIQNQTTYIPGSFIDISPS